MDISAEFVAARETGWHVEAALVETMIQALSRDDAQGASLVALVLIAWELAQGQVNVVVHER